MAHRAPTTASAPSRRRCCAPSRTTSGRTSARRSPSSSRRRSARSGSQFGRRFWEEDDRIFGGITDTNLDIGTIFYPSYGFHGAAVCVIGYYSYFADSETLAALSPEDRAARALEQGARIHGDAYRDEFEHAFSVHWQDQQFSDGGWIAVAAGPGRVARRTPPCSSRCSGSTSPATTSAT